MLERGLVASGRLLPVLSSFACQDSTWLYQVLSPSLSRCFSKNGYCTHHSTSIAKSSGYRDSHLGSAINSSSLNSLAISLGEPRLPVGLVST